MGFILRGIQVVVSLTCGLVFVLMAKQQYDTFQDEPTGSSLSSLSIADMPFPAISICDQHYEYGRAYRELGFPRSIFGRPPPAVSYHPLGFYQWLATFRLPIMPNLWKYYFTLDKIIQERDTTMHETDDRCRIGSVDCGYKKDDKVVGEGNEESIEVEVPAGKWISRFFSDSDRGTNHLCHTLVPNVTINFRGALGNSIAMMWKHNYTSSSYYWKVYVHDRAEHVLLNAYAIRTTPTITFSNLRDDGYLHLKKKVMALPRLTKHPAPSKVLPCGHKKQYSENWCKIQWGWAQKLKEVSSYHGANFTCRIPGIWSNESQLIPICGHYEVMSNGTLGLNDLSFHNSPDFE